MTHVKMCVMMRFSCETNFITSHTPPAKKFLNLTCIEESQLEQGSSWTFSRLSLSCFTRFRTRALSLIALGLYTSHTRPMSIAETFLAVKKRITDTVLKPVGDIMVKMVKALSKTHGIHLKNITNLNSLYI